MQICTGTGQCYPREISWEKNKQASLSLSIMNSPVGRLYQQNWVGIKKYEDCISNRNCVEYLAPTTPALCRQNQLAPFFVLLFRSYPSRALNSEHLRCEHCHLSPLPLLKTNTVYLAYYVHLKLYLCYILPISVNCAV